MQPTSRCPMKTIPICKVLNSLGGKKAEAEEMTARVSLERLNGLLIGGRRWREHQNCIPFERDDDADKANGKNGGQIPTSPEPCGALETVLFSLNSKIICR